MEDVMAEISLDATCGDLFDHIDDLLEFPSEDDVFLEMDPPARNSSCIVSPAVLEPFLPPPLQNHTLLGGESGDKLDHNCGATTESNSEEEKLVTVSCPSQQAANFVLICARTVCIYNADQVDHHHLEN